MNSAHSRLPALTPFPAVTADVDGTICGYLCQHPSCWTSLRQQENVVPRTQPHMQTHSDSSMDEISLPLQNICNLLDDFGDNIISPYTLSAGRCHSEGKGTGFLGSLTVNHPHSSKSHLKSSLGKTRTKVKLISKNSPHKAQLSGLSIMKAQDVFNSGDLKSSFNEPKQIYVWVPNPKKSHQRVKRNSEQIEQLTHSVLVKDMTESMVPQEISQKRQDSVLFSEWPTLKTRHGRSRSPAAMLERFHGALPTRYSKSFIASKGKTQIVINKSINSKNNTIKDEELIKNNQIQPLFDHKVLPGDGALELRSSEKHPADSRDHPMISSSTQDRQMSSNSTLKQTFQDVETSHLNTAGAWNKKELAWFLQNTLQYSSRIPSVSLGLPQLPAGARTTKPFYYRYRDWNLSLGPVIYPPSSSNSQADETDTDKSVPVKYTAPAASPNQVDSECQDTVEKAVQPISPLFASYVPVPDAGTTARPLKSCPPPEHWQLRTELSADGMFPSSASEPAVVATRPENQQARPKPKDDAGRTAWKDVPKAVNDDKLKSESPAPPPPSPELTVTGRKQTMRNVRTQDYKH